MLKIYLVKIVYSGSSAFLELFGRGVIIKHSREITEIKFKKISSVKRTKELLKTR